MSVFPNLDISMNDISGTIRYEYENQTYSFVGTGNYGEVDPTVNQHDPSVMLDRYDMTDALHVMFDVKSFNRKLGIVEDCTSFNGIEFPTDEITLNADEFLSGLNEKQIISVGKFNTLYSEFEEYVEEYFNYNGNQSMFNCETISSEILDAKGLLQVLSNDSDYKGYGVSVGDISGSITISNINTVLRSVVLSDVFKNRAYKTHADGFLAGDLIFIPNGMHLKLNVNIQTQTQTQNADILNLLQIALKSRYLVTSETITSPTNISRVVKVPILIRLSNIPEENVDNYIHCPNEADVGTYKWINVGYSQGANKWTCISMSASGMYQTIGQYDGPLMRTKDYGVSWTAVAPKVKWSGISISDTGEHQIACCYQGYLFVSCDFGVTWYSVASAENWSSVSINASGKYQSATVFNGRIWISSDYGVTWADVGDLQNWKSIDVSFTGQRQTAVAHDSGIYLSVNYGVDWTHMCLKYAWSSVAMSCSGQYQIACIDGGEVYSSIDYGNTWNVCTILGNQLWNSVAISGTGKYQTILSRYGDIYISDDYGVTWVNTTRNKLNYWAWNSVATTFSGNIQTCVVWDGSIYISKLF